MSLTVTNTTTDVRVIIEPPVQRGFYYETDIKIQRLGKADTRKFIIPHASPSLPPAIVREFYLTIVEWGIDCL